MPQFKIIKLKHLSPLHLGTGKENYDFSSGVLQSDSLSSSLCAVKALLGQEKEIESFLQSFTISSAFPYYKSTYFLPVGLGRLNISVSGTEETVYRKKLKKIRFADIALWQQLVKGGNLTLQDINQLQGSFLLSPQEENMDALSRRAIRQRVKVPRDEAKDSEPFYFEWTYYNPEGGLYCLVDARDDVFQHIKRLFSILGDNGIGTDKNIGGGHFEVEEKDETVTLPDVEGADSRMLLSLYVPSEEELKGLSLPDSTYELLQRGGFMAGSGQYAFRHLRKKSIYMFNVGSVFSTTDELKGKVVNLRPQWNDDQMHDVFRSGKALSIPIKYKTTEI